MGKHVTRKKGTWNFLSPEFWTKANWSQAARDRQAAAAARHDATAKRRALRPNVDDARLGELLADAATRPTATPQEEAAAPVEASTAPAAAAKPEHATAGPGFKAVAQVIVKANYEILRGEPTEISQKKAENRRRRHEVRGKLVALNDFLEQHNLRGDADMVLAALAPEHEAAAVNFINVVEATRKAHTHLPENFVRLAVQSVSRPFKAGGDHEGDIVHLANGVESLVKHSAQIDMPVWCTRQTPWFK